MRIKSKYPELQIQTVSPTIQKTKQRFHFFVVVENLEPFYYLGTKKKAQTNLFIAIFFIVLLLNNWAKVKGSVVYEIRGVLYQIQNREVEAQPHHTITRSHKKPKEKLLTCTNVVLGVNVIVGWTSSIYITTFSYGNSRWFAGSNQWTTMRKQSTPEPGTWFPAELNSRKP